MQKIKVRSLLFNELLKIFDTPFPWIFLSPASHPSQSDAAVPARDVICERKSTVLGVTTTADAAADAAAATATATTTAAGVRLWK